MELGTQARAASFNGAGDLSPDAIQACPHARPDTPQGIEFRSSFLALVAETGFVLAIAPDRVMHAPLPPVRRWCTSTALHTAQPAAAGPRGMEVREGGPRVAQRARLRLSATHAAAPRPPRSLRRHGPGHKGRVRRRPKPERIQVHLGRYREAGLPTRNVRNQHCVRGSDQASHRPKWDEAVSANRSASLRRAGQMPAMPVRATRGRTAQTAHTRVSPLVATGATKARGGFRGNR